MLKHVPIPDIKKHANHVSSDMLLNIFESSQEEMQAEKALLCGFQPHSPLGCQAGVAKAILHEAQCHPRVSHARVADVHSKHKTA